MRSLSPPEVEAHKMSINTTVWISGLQETKRSLISPTSLFALICSSLGTICDFRSDNQEQTEQN
jgi:hypothetical protein